MRFYWLHLVIVVAVWVSMAELEGYQVVKVPAVPEFVPQASISKAFEQLGGKLAVKAAVLEYDCWFLWVEVSREVVDEPWWPKRAAVVEQFVVLLLVPWATFLVLQVLCEQPQSLASQVCLEQAKGLACFQTPTLAEAVVTVV
jgi:hypothetical protein